MLNKTLLRVRERETLSKHLAGCVCVCFIFCSFAPDAFPIRQRLLALRKSTHELSWLGKSEQSAQRKKERTMESLSLSPCFPAFFGGGLEYEDF